MAYLEAENHVHNERKRRGGFGNYTTELSDVQINALLDNLSGLNSVHLGHFSFLFFYSLSLEDSEQFISFVHLGRWKYQHFFSKLFLLYTSSSHRAT